MQDGSENIKESTKDFESSRITRLLRIAQAIREDPHQPLAGLWTKLGIKKSQFYKDKSIG